MPPMHVRCRSSTAIDCDEQFGRRLARDADGKNIRVPANMTYEDWKSVYIDKKMTLTEWQKSSTVPSLKLVSQDSVTRKSKAELVKMAQEMDAIAAKYTSIKSKWSGNLVIGDAPDHKVGKLWNCDIALRSETAPHMLLHEHLHARSASYHGVASYIRYQRIEEAAVHFYSQEICLAEGLEVIESGYDEMVDALRKLNKLAGAKRKNFAFAKALYHVPLPKRLDWLEDWVYEAMKEKASVQKMTEAMDLLEVLR